MIGIVTQVGVCRRQHEWQGSWTEIRVGGAAAAAAVVWSVPEAASVMR